MIAPDTHDINGPSSLHRRAGCPGSAAQEVGMPDDGNEAAERGTRLHEFTASILRGEVQLFDVPAGDDFDAVAFCLEQSARYAEQAGADALRLVEHRVDLDALGIPGGGTIDVAYIKPGGEAYAIDHKYGRGFVDHPKWNWQAKAYAWGLREAFGCTSVTFGIAQPAAMPGYEFRETTWLGSELDAIAREIGAIVQATKQPDAPLIMGDHCGYCRARNKCPARASAAAAMTTILDPVASMRALSPQSRGDMYTKLAQAIDVLERAKGAIDASVIAGDFEIGGYKVVNGRRTRAWTNEAEACQLLLMEGIRTGKTQQGLIKTTIASPAEAEKMLGHEAKGRIQELTTWRDGKPRLVKAGPA